MNLATIIVTRSKSCQVKTLHTVLKMNMICMQNNVNNQIVYVDEDPYSKAAIIEKYIKTHDKIFFIDFGVGVDDETIKEVFKTHEGIGCLVFPGVSEGIDWELFKVKVKDGSDEPNAQKGLHFDTDVDKKISENIYTVSNTNPKCWLMYSKYMLKKIKDKKTTFKISPKMFDKFKEQGIKIHAFTASKLIVTYTHECISNILNAAGVKTG